MNDYDRIQAYDEGVGLQELQWLRWQRMSVST